MTTRTGPHLVGAMLCLAPATLAQFTPAKPSGGGTTFDRRTIDGTFNNLRNPEWGSAEVLLLRLAVSEYGDGLSAPAGASRPSARVVSNALCAQSSSVPNALGASDMVWQWGQFLDHDIDLTEGASPAEAFDIPVPTGDPFFDPFSTGTQVIALNRSLWETDAGGVRQQVNQITAFVDGSNVYGSDLARSLELRTLDGTGRLRTSAGELLPFNVNGFPNAPTALDPTMFLAGDVRANEQNGLTAMHTLFVREHNGWATAFAAVFPRANDEELYQMARTMVWAELQSITYNEFLPVLLGEGALPKYKGYRKKVDPGIDNAFSTASYRFGHSMLSPTLRRLDATGATIAAGDLPLRDAFFNPGEIVANGIEPLLRGLATQPAQEVDTLVVDDVRNFLFGSPGSGGFDLASLNIQRGRDHGLPDYNRLRADHGLAPVTSFAEITSDPALRAALQATYGSVDEIDAWVGGLAEDHVPGALVGELLRTVLGEQFARLRDGDRFFYRGLGKGLADFVETQTLAVIIRRNTSIGAELQDDVFRVPTP